MSTGKNIYLANHRGFCSGVKNAIKLVDKVSTNATSQIYIYHEIVHNKTVVDSLKERGIIFIDDINNLPADQILIFSAHGVSPAIREEAKNKNTTIIDATCKRVQKVHDKVLELVKKGYYILFIGHRNHEEVIGIFGESPKHIMVIENEDNLSQIPLDKGKYALLSQTTLNSSQIINMQEKIEKIIPNLFSDYASVCNATSYRQQAVDEIAEKVDIFYIIGSKNSSNANRLVEIAAKKTVSKLVENFSEINITDIENVDNIGLSSGASTPEELVLETINFFKSRFVCQLYGKL